VRRQTEAAPPTVHAAAAPETSPAPAATPEAAPSQNGAHSAPASSRAQQPLDERRIADRVYELVYDRLARDRERRGV
jgi:hypothetical protein